MAKQLKVHLGFDTNISQVQGEIKNLQQDLNKIMNMKVPVGKTVDTASLQEASAAAKELSYHLNQALDTNTGKLDLSKLNTSLQKGATSVTVLSNKLLQAGTIGQSAFVNLAKSISQAQYPMFKLNSQLTEMWTTLKNTARWQLSSSVLHGFMGALNSATGYAKDLDRSLNDIRIVTGLNTDKMTEFAAAANKAAKELNTTTTAYSDAALIFYQQGLGTKEVEERTAAVIKMANVTRDSETEVSSYMTAIWENFANEKQSLEEYADVITALGAATAASSAEIAGGLEKFAAIGQQIGLSYDYATTALATVVANTRQSEEVVGTAFKTIFARIQGLNLGETLDDGTTLNKYSDALRKVGINIKDATGELKDMDVILNEMGNTWNTLSRDQQVALAQTVAGTRQYTQLIALMDAWQTSFQDNLNVAQNSNGALQKQADIYADSWEAARDRVTAAAEGIYDSLINPDFMKDFNNVLADVLGGVENLIDGLGGLGGLVTSVGSFVLSLVAHKIQPAIQNLALNIKSLFVTSQQQARQLVTQIQSKNTSEMNSGHYDTAQKQALQNANVLSEARARLTVVSKNLTDQERLLYQTDIDNITLQATRAEQLAANITQIEKQTQLLRSSADAATENNSAIKIYNQLLKEQQELSMEALTRIKNGGGTGDRAAYNEAEMAISELQARKVELNQTMNESTAHLMQEYEALRKGTLSTDKFAAAAKGAIVPWQNLIKKLSQDISPDNIDAYKSSLEMINKTMPSIMRNSKQVREAMFNAFNAAQPEDFETALEQVQEALGEVDITADNVTQTMRDMNPVAFKELKVLLDQLVTDEVELKSVNDQLLQSLDNFNPSHLITGVERLTAAAAAMGQISMMASSINSLISTWGDENATFGEKLSTSLMSISLLVPGLISSFNSLNTVLQGTAFYEGVVSAVMGLLNKDLDVRAAKILLLTKVKQGELTTDQLRIVTIGAVSAALGKEKLGLDANKQAYISRLVAQKVANKASKEEIALFLAAKLGIDKDTAAKIANKIATDALNVSLKSLLGPIGLVIAALGGIIVVLQRYTQKTKEAAAAAKAEAQESAEAAKQKAQALADEQKALSSLYDQYVDLSAQMDGSTSAKEALKSKTEELCEALGIEWDALDKLQNKYGSVEKKILEARRTVLAGNIEEFKDDLKDVDKGIEYAVDEVKGKKFSEYDFGTSTDTRRVARDEQWYEYWEWFDGDDVGYDYQTYQRPYLNAGGSTNVGNDNIKIKNLFYDWMYQNHADLLQNETPISKDSTLYAQRGGQSFDFKEGTSESVIISATQEFAKYLQNNAKSLGVNTSAGSYTWFQDLLADEGVKEELEAATDINNNMIEALKEMAQIDTDLSGNDIKYIQTIEEYNAYKEQWKKQFEAAAKEQNVDISHITDTMLEEMANSYLQQFEHISKVVEENDASLMIAKKLGISKESVDALAAEYEDFFTFVAQIDFDKVKTKDQFEQALNILQAQADADHIQLTIDTISSAKGKLKQGMGLSEYDAFEQESGIAWGTKDKVTGQYIVDYGEFLRMSYEQQTDYLDQLEQNYITKQINAFNSQKQALTNQISEYQTELESLGKKAQNSRGILSYVDATRFAELVNLIATAKESLPELDGRLSALSRGLMSSVTTLEELETVTQQILSDGGKVYLEDYAAVILKVAESYKYCTEEAKAYEEACKSGDDALIAEAEAALRDEMALEDLTKQYDLNIDVVKIQAKQLMQDTKLKLTDIKAAEKLAIANQRLNKGVTTLSKNWESWNEILRSSDKTSVDYAKTIQEASEALADLTGSISADSIPTTFWEVATNIDLLERASQGEIQAINLLGLELAKSTVYAREFNAEIAENATEQGLLDRNFGLEEFNTYSQNVYEGIVALQKAIETNTLDETKSINDILNTGREGWVESLNQMAIATGMSVDEMNEILNQLGVQTHVTVKDVEQQMSVPTYTEVVEPTADIDINGDGKGDGVRGYRRYTIPGPSKTVKGTVQVAQISTEDGKEPDINYVGSGGSSAGVSSSSLPPLEEPQDPGRADKAQSKDPEVERNQKILFTLEKLEKEYDRISQAKERAFGLKKLDLIKSERDAIKNLIDSESAYVETLEEQLKTDAATLAALGIAIDEDGFVADLAKGADYSAYNKHVDDWNKWDAATQAEMDAEYKGQLNSSGHYASGYLDYFSYLKDDADDAYEKAQDAIEQYKKTQSDLEAAKDEALNYQNAYFDNLLEGTSYIVEIKLDIQDRDMRYLEFLLERIEDTSYNAAKSIAMIGIQGANAFKQINAAKEGLVGILQNHGMDAKSAQSIIDSNNFKSLTGMDFTEEEMSTMDDWIESIFEKNSTLLEMREAAWQNVRDEFNEYLEDMDKGIEKIDHLNSITNTYKNIVDILGVGVLGISNELIEDLNKASVKQSTNALKAAQSELEALKEARAKTLAIDTEGWSEDALREHQQTLDEMEESIMAAEEKAMGYWEQALQAATDAWHTSVTHIVDEFEDKIAGAMGSLSELQESFDRASEIDSRYVEEYEKIYELSKLTRQINKDIDASDNLHVKQELRDLAEEIAEIEASGAEMSEYDLENLQRRYELKKAELALEEAQGAKSSVSMVRGSDGSYNYVYTASEEDVAAAEQTYEDKLYAMQQANAEYINNLQSQIIQTQTECAEAIRALQEDTTLSTEEYEAKVAEITQYYEGQLGYYSDELNGVLGNNQTLYETDWQKYSEATGYKIAADKDYVDDFRETNLALVTEYDSLAAYQMSFNSSVETLLVDLSGAYRTWQGDIDTIMQEAGTSLDGFGEHVDDMVNGENGVVAKSDEAAESVESMAERMQEAFDATIKAITDWESEWGNQIDAAIEKNNELIESYNSMKSIMAEGVDNTSASALDALESSDNNEESNNEPETPETSSTPAPSSATGSGNGTPEVGDKVTYIGGTYYEQSSGKGRTGHRGPGGQVTITKIKPNANYPIHVKSSSSAYGWLKEDQITGFDTGGYTGNWGDTSGRLALLHQKELVLNASDTANLLSIVDMVREIANIIDLNAAAASGVYSSLTSAGNVMSGGAGTTQHVEIHASFPDAVDHSEIEQAFNNLINTASQYVNRDR